MRLIAMIVRRCLWMPPTLLGLLVLTFAISHVIPADPASVLAGENASREQVAALRHQYGLDRSLPVQLFRYIRSVASGDLGISLYTQAPIADDLAGRLPATMELALFAITLAVLLGVPLGVVSALRRNSVLDHVLRLVTVAGLATAAFWLAILLQLLFSMTLDLTPVQGRTEGWGAAPVTGFAVLDALLGADWAALRDALLHLALPAATLAIPALATIVRFTRAGVLNTASSAFVLYQSAMGFPRRVTVWKYILRAAMTGTLTQIGLVFGNLLAGAVVVEAVFDWPGLGQFAVRSILNSDYNGVMGFTLYAGAVFILVNLAVDVAQLLLDPRRR